MRRRFLTARCVVTFSAGIERPLTAAASFNDISFNLSMRIVCLSDLTREGALAPDLEGLTSWIACIADAQPPSDYEALLSRAAFTLSLTERHDDALVELVRQIQTTLLAAEVMVGLQKLVLPDLDLETVKAIAKHALEAARTGSLGYAIIVASKIDQAPASEART